MKYLNLDVCKIEQVHCSNMQNVQKGLESFQCYCMIEVTVKWQKSKP